LQLVRFADDAQGPAELRDLFASHADANHRDDPAPHNAALSTDHCAPQLLTPDTTRRSAASSYCSFKQHPACSPEAPIIRIL